jgi:hypothetical protein
MVRRYARLSVKHLQPYADQLILPDTVGESAKPLEVREKPELKSGHRRGPVRLRLIVNN